MSIEIEEVKKALKITDYKYFGEYEFSGNQHEAVMVLEEIAKSLLLDPTDTGEVILKRAAGVLWDNT